MREVGDRVLALWPGDRQWWYPGVICGTTDGQYEIQFDDGDRSLVPPSDIAALEFPDGAAVQARINRDLRYLPATILKVRGSALLLHLPQEIELWTSMAVVRTDREASLDWVTRN